MTTRKTHSKVFNYITCGLFAALTAIGAFIKIPLPPPLVDFTLQFLFAVLAGLVLGSKKGAISQVIYVITGLIGVPIFTKGGGIQYIFQPSFGYLLGFIVCAYVAGKVRESGKLSFKRLLLGSIFGLVILYAMGVPYMYMIYNFHLGQKIGLWALTFGGAIICSPGDIFLAICASFVAIKVIPILKKQGYIS